MIKFLPPTQPRDISGVALVRLDFNTEGLWRLESAVPTLKLLHRYARTIVILGHRGRPRRGKVVGAVPTGFDPHLSLRAQGRKLSQLLGQPIRFIPHFRFDDISRNLASAKKGSLYLLENLRFLEGEAGNDIHLARRLARLGDFYVNNAFAVCHRANASVTGIPKFLPSYAGLELHDEIVDLSRVMVKPRQPLIVVVGGAKASDKLGVIAHLHHIAKTFLIGGAAANTLLHLRGFDVGTSLVEEDGNLRAQLKKLLHDPRLVVPVDFVWKKNAIVDIGPKTATLFAKHLAKAGTIIWNGPMGRSEQKRYAAGSRAVARAIAQNKKAFSVVGGGETVTFLKTYRLEKKFGFVSTGGGAMLDFLAGKKLPGIEALKHSPSQKRV